MRRSFYLIVMLVTSAAGITGNLGGPVSGCVRDSSCVMPMKCSLY